MDRDRLISDSPRIQAWMHEQSKLPLQREFHGIAREVDGEIVAAFGYDNFQGVSCCLHACSSKPAGFNRSLLYHGFAVPYLQWDYRVLLGIIAEGNIKSRRFATHLGFTEFAVVPDSCSSGALHFFQMRRENCRWLKLAERVK